MMGRLEPYSYASAHDLVSDGLDNYDILEEIGRGGTSIVYLAICKRGRLRDRQVAIKKIRRKPSSAPAPHLSSSTSLHQALHHPTILSLLSAFSTTTTDYHVLELCSRDTLSNYLVTCNPPVLSECELRGVLKSLTEALLYLRKERVIHRDIKTSNILLTDDYRVKLADFGLATRLPTVKSTTSTFCGSPNYVSPEIVSGRPYSFSTDLWSLGCVVVTCLAGNLPSMADDVSGTCEQVSSASNNLPQTVSFEVKDLTFSLLQIDPADRIPLHRITSHPFFNPAFPITSLGLKVPSGSTSREALAKSFARQDRHPDKSRNEPPRLLPFPQKLAVPRGRGRHSDASTSLIGRRQTLRNIGNVDLRHILSDEVPSTVKFPAIVSSTRRIVSDPTPQLARSLSSKLAAPSSAFTSSKDHHTSEQEPHRKNLPFPLINHPLLSVPDINLGSLATAKQTPQPHPHLRNPYPGHAAIDVSPSIDLCNVIQFNNTPPVSIGTTRPLRFTTYLLNAQMHKTVHGQVTILPSRSLLVDFREGERRRGKKGDQVFVADPDGAKIKIYNAPHLSTPCCLAEPVAVYSIEDLPSTYWKQYNDAGRLIEQIKQKTPKLIMYKSEVKCTLMANDPQANIELLFQSCSHQKDGDAGSDIQKPCMRMRLSRQNHSLEIARHISGARGGEWTKKTLVATREPRVVGEAEWKELDVTEKDGLKCLSEFLEVSEAVELLEKGGSARRPLPPIVTPSVIGFRHAPSDKQYPIGDEILPSSSAPPIQKTLPTVNITSRPPKLDPATGKHGACNNLPRVVNESTGTGRQRLGRSFQSGTVQWRQEEHSISAAIQTRFVPSVGWCIRYGSSVSQGGRYRMLFLDGVIVDVDVDEEWVEFRSGEGDVTRHKIRDYSKKIGERLKVFEEFVSMFDDST